MNKALYSVSGLVAVLLTSALAPGAEAQQVYLPHAVDLRALIDRAAAETGREIVYNQQLLSNVFEVASTETGDGDYDTLQAALRSIGFFAVETDDQILILPDALARTAPSRVLQQDDRQVSDHAIVTRIIEVPPLEIETADGVQTIENAAQMVPILRPMLSTNAQLGAVQNSNSLVMVDRYDNVRRITRIIEELVGGD